MKVFRGLALALSAALLCACNSAVRSPARPTLTAQESARIAPVVNRHKKDALMGFDINGETLVVSADAEKWSELDDALESALKDELLATWVRTWRAYHPHGHAHLKVLIRNYYGQEITSVTQTT